MSEFGSRNESDRWDPPITCIHGVPVEDRCGECWGIEDESGDLYDVLLDETAECEHGALGSDECERCEESEDDNAIS
jgi:hypothetical protein